MWWQLVDHAKRSCSAEPNSSRGGKVIRAVLPRRERRKVGRSMGVNEKAPTEAGAKFSLRLIAIMINSGIPILAT